MLSLYAKAIVLGQHDLSGLYRTKYDCGNCMALSRHNKQLFCSILLHLTFVAAYSPRLALLSPLTATDKIRQYFSVGPDVVFVFTLPQLRVFPLMQLSRGAPTLFMHPKKRTSRARMLCKGSYITIIASHFTGCR